MARVTTTGLADMHREIQRKQAALDRAARTITAQSAALIEAQTKRNFVGSHRKGAPHVGGNRPNVVTGQTRRSILTDPIVRVGHGTYQTRVGPTVAWGRRLELGGTGPPHVTTRPFPYLAPAVAGSRAQLHAIALTQWGRALS